MSNRWAQRCAALMVILAAVALPAGSLRVSHALAAAPRAAAQAPAAQSFGSKVFLLAIQVLAKKAKMTPAAVRAALHQGKSLAQVAAAHKISRAALQKAILTQVTLRLQRSVSHKKISAGSSQTLYKSIAAKITLLLDYKLKPRAPATAPKHKAKAKHKKAAPTH